MEERRRSACLEACEFAVQQTGIESPLVHEAIQALRASTPLSQDATRALEALRDRLDDEYFGLQVAADEGRATADDYTKPFQQARAAAALCYATQQGALGAVEEAIYEAAYATDDQEGFVSAVLKALREPSAPE